MATGGTVLASKLALDTKMACNTAGGSQTQLSIWVQVIAFNDVAVSANYLKIEDTPKKYL